MAKKEEAQIVSKRVSWAIWGLLAVLVVLLVSAFSKAWQTNRTLKAELDVMQPMATAAMAEKIALETQLTYVQSDEYVEGWSQTRAGMSRPGETLIISVEVTPIPIPTPQMLEMPTPEPTQVPLLPRLWQTLLGN
jgi:cell division protein FtsB